MTNTQLPQALAWEAWKGNQMKGLVQGKNRFDSAICSKYRQAFGT